MNLSILHMMALKALSTTLAEHAYEIQRSSWYSCEQNQAGFSLSASRAQKLVSFLSRLMKDIISLTSPGFANILNHPQQPSL